MLNHCEYMGRLLADPEVKYTNESIPVVSFGIASERDVKTKSGEKLTDFFDCVAWRNTATYIGKYFHKGDLVVVEGRNQARTWTDSEGKKHKVVELNVDNIYTCRKAGDGTKTEAEAYNAPAPMAAKESSPVQNHKPTFEDYMENDELPF